MDAEGDDGDGDDAHCMQILKVMGVIGQNVKQENFIHEDFPGGLLPQVEADKQHLGQKWFCQRKLHPVTSYPVTSSSQSEHLVGFI